jgi:uncharacterized membrane protein YwzB
MTIQRVVAFVLGFVLSAFFMNLLAAYQGHW